jgi:serine/threonine protein kinase/tetratricopeptide (TPR) repeat protein
VGASDQDPDTEDGPPTVSSHGRKDSTRLKIGDLVGARYELLDEIGHGAFGRVFRAKDRVAEQIVALKAFSVRQTPEAVKRLKREVQTAHRVTHPGVVRTYDLVEAEGQLFVSMEYVEGETLSSKIRKVGKLTSDELSQLGLDIARALSAAHRAGVIHRDLKPANVLLRSSNGRAVIADFGISRDHDAEGDEEAITREGHAVGTPQYMAPEQLLGREAGPAADLYAFGLVMFEAATGRRPHKGTNSAELALERVGKPAPDLEAERKDLAVPLLRAIDKCLQSKPEQRFADGEALKLALMPMAATGDITTPSPRLPPVLLLKITGSLIACALLVAGAFWMLRPAIPKHDRRISFRSATVAGTEGWIARPLERLLVRRLNTREPRMRLTSDAGEANLEVALEVAQQDANVRVVARFGAPGSARRELATIVAPSLAVAAEQLADAIWKKFGADQPLREPTAAEQSEMRDLGASSFLAWWLYRSEIAEGFSAVLIDAEASERSLRKVLSLDPKWAHPWVDLVDQIGIATERGRQTMAEARAAIEGSTQDPVGHHLLAAQSLIIEGKLAEAATLLDPDYRAHPMDIELGWILSRRVFHISGRTEDAIAVFQKLYGERPDLQFGANLTDELRRAGRGREVPAIVQDWLDRAPESEDARAAQVVIDLEAGKLDSAIARAREQLFVHGDAPHRLATLSDTLIVAGQNAEASKLAQQMLRGSGPIRSRGYLRLGLIATLEGRFSSAMDALHQAIAEGKAYPTQSGLRDAYESARWLAQLVGRTDEAERYDGELAEFWRRSGMPWQAAAVEFERKLKRVRESGCPSREAALKPIAFGPGRRLAAMIMLRDSAEVGCASCADVVKEGMAADEWNQASLYRFGMCAAQTGSLSLARDAFERARPLRLAALDAGTAPSVAYAVLARYQLARVLERIGQTKEARASYQDFLSHWGHADRPMPEADEALKALDRLK